MMKKTILMLLLVGWLSPLTLATDPQKPQRDQAKFKAYQQRLKAKRDNALSIRRIRFQPSRTPYGYGRLTTPNCGPRRRTPVMSPYQIRKTLLENCPINGGCPVKKTDAELLEEVAHTRVRR